MTLLKKLLPSFCIAAATFSSFAADNILSIRDTIKDPNLVYPESYEADVHNLRKNWYLQNYVLLDKQGDTSPDVVTTDAQYIERLQKMPTSIEMPFNDIVKSYIEMYTGRKRSLVETMLGMSTYYMPIFEEALEREGMPLELKYLPIVESALNPDAVSPAGATGLWQFMLPTGRDMGLEISTLVDERRDPLKSSEAAAKFLKQLYGIYGDWSLAIAAYNCGPGNVNKALRLAGGGKKDFWEIYPYLPKETKGYVPVFIAANYVMNYYDKHGISPALARRPILTDTVHVNNRVHFNQISEVLDIPVAALRTLNPQYRQDIIPGNAHPYVLILPSHQALAYTVSRDSITTHNMNLYAQRSTVEVNTGKSSKKKDKDEVKATDNNNMDLAANTDSNKTSDNSKDSAASTRQVAVRRNSDKSSAAVETNAKGEKIIYHKVTKDDTFASLAEQYGVTVASIQENNGIKNLRRGRTVKIVTTADIASADLTSSSTADQAPQIMSEETASVTPAAKNQVAESKPVASAAPTKSSGSKKNDTASNSRNSKNNKNAQKAKNDKKSKKNKNTKRERKSFHTVKSGENFTTIARRNGVSVSDIQKLNPGVKAGRIQPGQKIRVK